MFGNLYLYLFVYVSPGLRAEAEPPERARLAARIFRPDAQRSGIIR